MVQLALDVAPSKAVPPGYGHDCTTGGDTRGWMAISNPQGRDEATAVRPVARCRPAPDTGRVK